MTYSCTESVYWCIHRYFSFWTSVVFTKLYYIMQRELFEAIFAFLCSAFVSVDSQKVFSSLVLDFGNWTTSTIDTGQRIDQGSCLVQQNQSSKYWEVLNGEDVSLKFMCKEGYILSSQNPYASCDNYNDKSAFPTCEKKCPDLHSTSSTSLKCFDRENIEIGCDSATEGSYVTFTCASLYESPAGTNSIFCSDGHWNTSTFACEPVCGRRVNRTTTSSDGENAPEEYPWTLGIYRRVADAFTNICGGTIISEKLVLTAAHCLSTSSQDDDDTFEINYMVAAGTLYNTFKDPRDTNAQYLDVIRIITETRRQEEPSTYARDIAILVTKQKFNFNDFVQPVCVSGLKNINLESGDLGMVLGWGIVKPGDEPSDKLKILEIPYKTQATCLAELPQDWRDKYLTEDKFCAGLFNQSRSICLGDGGAGLIYKNKEDDKYYVHGVVSIAHAIDGECNVQQNALYTNVSFYEEFVTNEMKNNLVKDCTLPPHPENGIWTIENEYKNPGQIVPSDTVLVVSCREGFKLSTEKTKIICDLSHLMPQCEKLCPPVPKSLAIVECVDESQNVIGCDQATDGSTLTYSCPPLHSPPFGYNTVIHCVRGDWDSLGPKCDPICGKKVSDDVVPLLYGASKVKNIEYPWVVALYQKSKKGYKHICSGSIISYKLIITAAHCVTNYYGDPLAPDNYLVASGKLYNEYQDPRDPRAQYVKIFRIIPKRDYRAADRNYLGDIALLVTKTSIAFNHFVHPICFERLDEITLKPGAVGVVTGWGVTEQGKPSDELRRLELPYKPQDLCAKELPPTWDNKYNLIDKICAGLYNQNMSVCKGDSGGGLFYQNEVDGRFYLHGVVSLGVGNKGECDFRYNTLYTSVAFHYDFVYSTYVTYTEDCKLPAQLTNGKWTIEGQDKKPGDRVSADTVLTITCEEGFRLYPNISTIACASASLIPKCLKITCKDGNPYPRLTCMYDGQEGAYLTDFTSFALLCSRIIYNRIELNQDGQLRTSADYNVDHALTSLIRPVTDTILITVYGSSKREVDEFSIVAANQTARKTFIDSVMAFVEKYNLYGANIHWDSPQVKDRVNYGILIKEMKERFKLFTRWKLFLSATVNHSPENLGYNHIEMYNNLDWINVECYDRPDSEGDSSRSYFESCAENWLSYSYKDKLSLGIGAFGRYFTFKNPDEHEPNAPPVAGSLDSKRTERIPYIKILKEYTNWTKAWDDKEKHPYVYNGSDWIGYDDINSTELKAKYITDNNYFGATVYPVNWDPSFSTNTLIRVVSHHFEVVFKDWLRVDDKCRPLVI